MLRKMMTSAVLMAGILMAGLTAQASPNPLTNNDVTTLAQAGVGEDAIIAAIQALDSSFDISVPALLKLKQDGITPEVLHAMVEATSKNGAATSQTSSQPAASATPEQTKQAPAASPAPSAPTTNKKWHKAAAAFGAVGRALSSAGGNFANGTGQMGNSFTSGLLSGLTNAANRQSNGNFAGAPNQFGSGSGFAAAPQDQATGYYTTENGNIIEVAAHSAKGPEQYASPATNQARISFTSWRDPREGAFTMNVPQGWQITGGTVRNSAMDPRPAVRATSPDHRIQLFYGDANLIPREVPNRLTAMVGIREGQVTKGSWGGPVLMARYETGEQVAHSYIAPQLCRAPQITSSGTLPDATRQLSAAAVAYGRTQGAQAQAWVGETNFRCGGQIGYVRASTVLAGSATGQGIGMWFVMELTGFMAADSSEAAIARYVMNTMAGSYQLDPQWEAQQAQTTRDVTGAVTRAQNQMAATIAQNARQQAQSNQVDVMSGWEARNKVMDGIMQRDSDTRRGTTTVTDDITGSHTISNDHNYYWTRPDQTIVGTNTDNPPDYSSGWRLMNNGNR
jgi:hypothetical protein